MASDSDLLKWIPQLLRGAVSALAWRIFFLLSAAIALSYWFNSPSDYITLWVGVLVSLAIASACAAGAAKFSGVTRVVRRSDPNFIISFSALSIITFSPLALIWARLCLPAPLWWPISLGILLVAGAALIMSPAVPEPHRSEATLARKFSTPLWVSGVIITMGSDFAGHRLGTGYLRGLIPDYFLQDYLSIRVFALIVVSLVFITFVSIDVFQQFSTRQPLQITRPEGLRPSDVLIPERSIPDSPPGLSWIPVALERGSVIIAQWIDATKVWLYNRWAVAVYYFWRAFYFSRDAISYIATSLVKTFLELIGRHQWRISFLVSLAIVSNVLIASHLSDLLILVHASYSSAHYDAIVLLYGAAGAAWALLLSYTFFSLCFQDGDRVLFVPAEVALATLRGIWFSSLFGQVFYFTASVMMGGAVAGSNLLHGHYFFNVIIIGFVYFAALYWRRPDENVPRNWGLRRWLIVALLAVVLTAWALHIYRDDYRQFWRLPASTTMQDTAPRPRSTAPLGPTSAPTDALSEEVTWLDGSWGLERGCRSGRWRFQILNKTLQVYEAGDRKPDIQQIIKQSDDRIRTDTTTYRRTGKGMSYELDAYTKADLVRCE